MPESRAARRIAVALLLATTILSMLPAAAAANDPPPLPATMAATGDSISQAASTGGSLGADYPENSWSTGTNPNVNSHYLRLAAMNPAITAQNASVSGAKVADLNAQMQAIAASQPAYVTVLIGGNDVCTPSEAAMTPVDQYRASFEAAMATLIGNSPNTLVYVVSIPDAYQLWNLFKGSWWARFVWSAGGVCQSLLANPTSTQTADIERRARVRQRNIDYNAIMADVCAQYPANCRWDNNAIFNTVFVASDVSGDYFHPSLSGQARLAQISWDAGYWAGVAPPPPPPNQPPVASFTSSCTNLTCSFADTSTDADGVIASRSWNFGDGATSAAAAPSRTYAAAGTYTVSLTVTDDDLATAATSSTVMVTAPPPPTMRVQGLSYSRSTSSRSWTARVTIHVTTATGANLPNATVSAGWSIGAPDTCVTSSTGRCSVTSDSLSRSSVPSVTMTVNNLTHATYVWNNPTPKPSITVPRP